MTSPALLCPASCPLIMMIPNVVVKILSLSVVQFFMSSCHDSQKQSSEPNHLKASSGFPAISNTDFSHFSRALLVPGFDCTSWQYPFHKKAVITWQVAEAAETLQPENDMQSVVSQSVRGIFSGYLLWYAMVISCHINAPCWIHC